MGLWTRRMELDSDIHGSLPSIKWSHHVSSHHLPPVRACVFTWCSTPRCLFCASHQDPSQMGLGGPTLLQCDLILTDISMTSAKIVSPDKYLRRPMLTDDKKDGTIQIDIKIRARCSNLPF
ncbi:uncharacterized protein RBU33_003582 [Hipposideros larvatus]